VAASNESVIAYGSVTDAVLDRLRDSIVQGELKPGEWLKQDELADRFGVSTMPVREALRRLESEGIVEFLPRRGARVIQISASEMEELWSIREELAVLACRWVSRDMSCIPLERLREVYSALQDAADRGDLSRRLELSREFFFTIFEAGQTRHIVRILSTVWDASFQYRLFYLRVATKHIGPALDPIYERVFNACVSRDGSALVQSMQEEWSVIWHGDIQREFVQHLRDIEAS
jgi:DNA-binding GntR family transcriptional regulator